MSEITIQFKKIGLDRAVKLRLDKIFVDELGEELEDAVVPAIQRDFESTVSTFQEVKIGFGVQMGVSNREIEAIVFPVGTEEDVEIYETINEGVPWKHQTLGGNKVFAIPQGTYSPKTRPGRLQAQGGNRPPEDADRAVVKSRFWGIDPRNFDEQVRDRHKDTVRRHAENAMRRAIRRVNNAYGET